MIGCAGEGYKMWTFHWCHLDIRMMQFSSDCQGFVALITSWLDKLQWIICCVWMMGVNWRCFEKTKHKGLKTHKALERWWMPHKMWPLPLPGVDLLLCLYSIFGLGFEKRLNGILWNGSGKCSEKSWLFLGRKWSREKAKCGFISGVHLREASPTIMWALGGLKPPTGCNSRNYTSYWDPPSQPPYPPSLDPSHPPNLPRSLHTRVNVMNILHSCVIYQQNQETELCIV